MENITFIAPKGLYISNASYRLVIKKGALTHPENIFVAKIFDLAKFSDDIIINKLKKAYDACQLINDKLVRHKSNLDGWADLFMPYTIETQAQNLIETKAYLLFDMQNLTNCYAYRHGATIDDIMTISYYDPYLSLNTFFKQCSDNGDLTRFDELDGASELNHNLSTLIRCIANKPSAKSIWDKLINRGIIPQYGYCNGTNEFYLAGIISIISRHFDDSTRAHMANKIDALIKNVLMTKRHGRGQAEITHIMMAAYFSGCFDDIDNISYIINKYYGLKIDKGQATTIIKSYWAIICDKSGIAIYQSGSRQNKAFSVDEVKRQLSKYIYNNMDDWINNIIKDTRCHRYYTELVKYKTSHKK